MRTRRYINGFVEVERWIQSWCSRLFMLKQQWSKLYSDLIHFQSKSRCQRLVIGLILQTCVSNYCYLIVGTVFSVVTQSTQLHRGVTRSGAVCNFVIPTAVWPLLLLLALYHTTVCYYNNHRLIYVLFSKRCYVQKVKIVLRRLNLCRFSLLMFDFEVISKVINSIHFYFIYIASYHNILSYDTFQIEQG